MSSNRDDADPILATMREVGRRSVAEAREAYARYATFGERINNTWEDWARRSWLGARELAYRAWSFADENVQHGFDHAERLVNAADMSEFVALQRDHWDGRTRRMAEQMRELGEMSARMAHDAAAAAGSTDDRPSSWR